MTAGPVARAASIWRDPGAEWATPVGHSLRDLAVAAMLAQAAPAADASPEVAALADRASSLTDAAWANALMAALADPLPADEPLLRLADALRFDTVELLAIALAAAVEDDALLGRAIARLQAPVGGSRPTLGLLAAALAPALGPGVPPLAALDALVAGRAAASGVLTLGAEGAPLPERTASVPLYVCLALRGIDVAPAGCAIDVADDRAALLPPSIVEAAERQAKALDGGGRRLLVVRGGSPIEGRAVARTVAAALGRRALWIDGAPPTALAAWCALSALLPIWSVELAPGERHLVPIAPTHDGPVVVLAGPDGTVDATDAVVATWTLPVPTEAERRALWTAGVGDPDLAGTLARDHRHGSGRIAHLTRLARHHAAVGGRVAPVAADVAAAGWTLEGTGLESLAQPLRERVDDDALVVPAALRAELHALVERCRARDGLANGLGPAAATRYRPGVRALLVGPSGTGKTLAASWLATRLGLPLWRVDLASVTSKYIGETEKNLAQLLARAEHADVILLFDEADSLFGKRTEVRDANDRFANAQTNYLLQRIETFEGITLLTSNSRSRFDAAFARRLDVLLELPLPSPEERRALWHAHLGATHALTSRELNQLAARVDVAGGHIRNVVLAAAVTARAEQVPIGWSHVVRALAGEYRKLGRPVPGELAG